MDKGAGLEIWISYMYLWIFLISYIYHWKFEVFFSFMKQNHFDHYDFSISIISVKYLIRTVFVNDLIRTYWVWLMHFINLKFLCTEEICLQQIEFRRWFQKQCGAFLKTTLEVYGFFMYWNLLSFRTSVWSFDFVSIKYVQFNKYARSIFEIV